MISLMSFPLFGNNSRKFPIFGELSKWIGTSWQFQLLCVMSQSNCCPPCPWHFLCLKNGNCRGGRVRESLHMRSRICPKQWYLQKLSFWICHRLENMFHFRHSSWALSSYDQNIIPRRFSHLYQGKVEGHMWSFNCLPWAPTGLVDWLIGGGGLVWLIG